MRIEVVAGSDHFASHVATLLVAEARAAIASRGVFHLVLAGGSTPRHIYQQLRELSDHDPAVRELWRNTHFFWGDERSVPPTHADSNYRMALETWLEPAGIEVSHIHRMPAEHADLESAAEGYAQELARVVAARAGDIPVLDLVLLGMGDDGHTASLFPGTSALTVKDRLIAANDVPQLQTRRMTMTYPLLNQARAVWFLVTGAGKVSRIQEVLGPAGPATLPQVTYPCQLIAPVAGELIWFLDADAAGPITAGPRSFGSSRAGG